ncbi:MAG TPA: DUF3095 family protein [Stellaceae bacterium]|nr:DUF3095 family protein [Stellaceae bacterium]
MADRIDFYQHLPPIRSANAAFDEISYARAPGDWLLAFSDIRDSTTAVAAGRHSEVNFAAAAMIAALTNECGSIPYQFGGDGAVALVPPDKAAAARLALARTRGFAAREFGLDLRIGLAPVSALSGRGASVLVGRYEPAPGSAYAVFRGGGIALFERAVKGGGDPDLARSAIIADTEDDGEPPDLSGLSCRWTPVRSARGRMVSLVLRAADHASLHRDLARVAGVPNLNAVTPGALKARWPPKGLMREAKARHRKMPLPLMTVLVALETMLAFVIVHFRLKVGAFDTNRYIGEVERGAVDFARSDETLCVVFDCPAERVEAVRSYLDERAAKGDLNYGMHVSDHAVMTCLVVSPTAGQHVHFIDGGDGGYTNAAIHLKAQLRLV